MLMKKYLYFIIFNSTFLILNSFCFAQQNKIDSLLSLIKIDIEDTTKVKHLNDLGWELMYQNPDSAIILGNQALAIITPVLSTEFNSTREGIENKKIKLLRAKTFGNLGVYYCLKADYPQSLNYYLMALKINEELKNKKGISAQLGNIGIIYFYQADYPKALDYFFKALRLAEEQENKILIATFLCNIGNVYSDQRDYPKALDYFFKAMKMDEEVGNKNGIARNFNNIGNIYQEQGNYSKALEYIFKGLKIQKDLGNKNGIVVDLGSIGNIYQRQQNYPTALEFYLKALKLAEELGDKNGIAIWMANIGSIYIKTGKFKEAERYIKRAIDLNASIGATDNLKQTEEILSQLYDTTGQYQQALIHYKKSIALKDTIYSQENKKQLIRKEMNYAFDKKEAATKAENEKQTAVAEEKSRKQNIITLSIALGLFLVMVFAGFIVRSLRIANKQKKIIESQNFQIVESINYSKKIQDSLLPTIESMQKAIPGISVFYEPKAIVSGDFYYFKEFEKYTLLACVDCTGHGVPGGFMSTLGSLLLDKIANNDSLSPSEILNKLSDEIIRVLHQQDGGEIQDGMDLSICLIDRNNKKIEYSGARNGIIVVTNEQAKRYKADPLPVGGNYMKKGIAIERNFKTQSISIDSTDWIYMYTDGFMEQVGGAEGIPMNYSQFENQLINVSKKESPEEKNKLLQAELDNWRGTHERDDDVLIIGFQVV